MAPTSRRTFSNGDPARSTLSNAPPGLVTISKRRFENRSSSSDDSRHDSGYATGSVTSAASMMDRMSLSPPSSIPPNTPHDLLQVPELLESKETLVFLGLTASTADEIFGRWQAVPADVLQDDFCGFAKNLLDERYLTLPRDTSPQIMLARLGASSQLADDIMAPGHDDVRSVRLGCPIPSSSRGNAQGTPSKGTSQGQGKGVATKQQDAQKGGKAQSAGSSLAIAASQSKTQPGYTRLWKCVTRVRAEAMWSGPFRSGQFNTASLRSRSPGDFSPVPGAHYFTPTVDGAKRYTKYAEKLAGVAGVCLVAIDVPNKLIESMNRYKLTFPSDDFKSVIFACRNGRNLYSVNKKIASADLLIGDTTTGTATVYEKLGSYKDIEERHLLKVEVDGSEERLTQYVWFQKMEAEIEDECEFLTSIRHKVDHEQLLDPMDVTDKLDKEA